MYGILKEWITSIVVVVIFLALVDMIMPSGALKKYTKLATGLIVIVAIMSPVFKFLNSGYNLENKVENYISLYDAATLHEDNKMNGEYSKETIDLYKVNLENSINKELQRNKIRYSVSSLAIDNNSKSNHFLEIKHIELKIVQKKEAIERVVNVNLKDNNDQEDSTWDDKAASLLVNSFGINESNIQFVR